jgi:integral membrane protein
MKTRLEIKNQAKALIKTNNLWLAIGFPILILPLALLLYFLTSQDILALIFLPAIGVGIYELGVQIYLYQVINGKKEIREGTLNQILDIINSITYESFATYFVSAVLIFCFSLIPIVGSIISLVKTLSYNLAIFLSIDKEENSSLQNINESRFIMIGHKSDLFVLSLSFIGWQILSTLTLSLLSIWIYPYVIASEVIFADDVLKNKNISKVSLDSGLGKAVQVIDEE